MALCKIVILGDGGVGKSCITIQLTQNIFVSEYDPTVENSYRKQVVVDDEPMMLDILDTAGQEDYSILRDQYIRTGQGFLIVYSITSAVTFKGVPDLRQKILGVKDEEEYPMILVGNKCDLEKERSVTVAEGQELAKSFSIPFFETSAKARINIEECFYELVREIRRWNAEIGPGSEPNSENPVQAKKPKKKGGCLLL